MSRCVIVGAGDIAPGDIPKKSDGELWIAADGGYRHLARAGITPDLFIGDLDSDSSAPADVPSVILPVVKDDTDTVAAVKAGFDRGYRNFLILGGLFGKRFSHTMANLQLLAYIKSLGGSGTLLCEKTVVRLLSAGESVDFKGHSGYFSLFSAGESATVAVSDAKYEGDNISLFRTFPLGVSNEFGKSTSVSVKSGEVYLVIDGQEK